MKKPYTLPIFIVVAYLPLPYSRFISESSKLVGKQALYLRRAETIDTDEAGGEFPCVRANS